MRPAGVLVLVGVATTVSLVGVTTAATLSMRGERDAARRELAQVQQELSIARGELARKGPSEDTQLLNNFERFGCAVQYGSWDGDKKPDSWRYACNDNVVKGLKSARAAIRLLVVAEEARR